MATSVMPAASAVRTASAVGAETATITGAPIAAAFCTISTETRLVSSTMPSPAASRRAPARRRACRARCAGRHPRARRRGRCAGVQNAAACTARVSMLSVCSGANACHRRHDLAAVRTTGPCGTIAAGRTASAIDFDAAEAAAGRAGDMPPPLVQPRPPSRCASHMRSSMPSSCSTISRDSISSGDWTMPSVRLKPTAKSSQILRRRHHHGVGAAVVGQRDRGLLRDRRASPALSAAVAPDLRDRLCGPDRAFAYSAASTPARCGATGGPARHSPSASRSGRSTARPAPPSPCIPGSWSPSRNSRW